jgi:Co/Zn/Cd efflux system component
MQANHSLFRRAVLIVALLNFGYFFVEFSVALSIDSVSLFADSIDFFEDAAVNILIFIAIGWSLYRRSQVGMGLAFILLIPGTLTLWTAWEKLLVPTPPEVIQLSITGFGALIINISCAFILARYRKQSGSLARAAFLSARNDALANLAIIGAAIITAFTLSAWPDLIIGLAIFLMNLDAGREVYLAATKERKSALE